VHEHMHADICITCHCIVTVGFHAACVAEFSADGGRVERT